MASSSLDPRAGAIRPRCVVVVEYIASARNAPDQVLRCLPHERREGGRCLPVACSGVTRRRFALRRMTWVCALPLVFLRFVRETPPGKGETRKSCHPDRRFVIAAGDFRHGRCLKPRHVAGPRSRGSRRFDCCHLRRCLQPPASITRRRERELTFESAVEGGLGFVTDVQRDLEHAVVGGF